jgi:hypothetical protein
VDLIDIDESEGDYKYERNFGKHTPLIFCCGRPIFTIGPDFVTSLGLFACVLISGVVLYSFVRVTD